MKKILIIAYVFPPSAYVGVYRTLKYCKNIPTHGWHPIVLTIKPKDIEITDDSLFKELPENIPVYRTNNLDPIKWISRQFKIFNTKSRSSTHTQSKKENKQSLVVKKISAFFKKLIVQLISTPDSNIFWVPFALLKGFNILLRHKVNLIYCSSPPHSSLIIAFCLSKLFKTKYVVDLRDPWLGTSHKPFDAHKLKFLLFLESHLRNIIINNASIIITATRGEQNELIEEYPNLERNRFTFITNGYDTDDFKNMEHSQKMSSKFVITYTGTIYNGTGDEFFESIQHLITAHPELQNTLQVNFMGVINQGYYDMSIRMGLQHVIKFHGFQPHAIVLKHVVESDLLLILLGGNLFAPSEIPAKTFEYMYSGNPILAVTRTGDLTEVLECSGLGFCVPPNDVAQLSSTIWDIYNDKRYGKQIVSPNWAYIKSFDRRNLSKKLASILDSVT